MQKGSDRFRNKIATNVINELKGICPSCLKEKPILDQWQSIAELSFYQTTNENHLSYAFPTSAFKLCQSCADLLFIFKQHLLEVLSRKLGGNECLVLPSIKLIPLDENEKRRLYENLKGLWGVSDSDVSLAVIHGTNNYLNQMWSLTGRNWNCTWSVRDDFQLLQGLFHPAWDEDKKNKDRNRKRYKSLRRPEMERYLRAIFYGHEASFNEIAEDCYSNLLSAFRTSRTGNDKYALANYIGDILSLMVFIYKLKNFSDSEAVQ